MPGPIRKIIERRKVLRRLKRVVAAERASQRPGIHPDELARRNELVKVVKARKWLKAGQRAYSAAGALAGSGAGEYGGMAAMTGGALRAIGQVKLTGAQERLNAAERRTVLRRLTEPKPRKAPPLVGKKRPRGAKK